MAKLRDMAKVLRSKNAGPLAVTIDVMFPNLSDYQTASVSEALSQGSVAAIYGVPSSEIKRVLVPGALAIKFTLPRPVIAGSPGDYDVYGSQQHRFLLEVEV